MKADERQAAHFDNMKDCVEQVSKNLQGLVYFTLFFFFIVFAFITFHFAVVLYTHWQNAELSEEEGGCAE